MNHLAQPPTTGQPQQATNGNSQSQPLSESPIDLVDLDAWESFRGYQEWPAIIRGLLATNGDSAVYDVCHGAPSDQLWEMLRGDNSTAIQWPVSSHSSRARAKLFEEDMDSRTLLQCERCERLYNGKMIDISPRTPKSQEKYDFKGPFRKMPFVFCAGSRDGSCQRRATPSWTARLGKVFTFYDPTLATVSAIMDHLNPVDLTTCLTGCSPAEVPEGLGQLCLAHRALRVLWLRHFSRRLNPAQLASTPGTTPDGSPERSPVASRSRTRVPKRPIGPPQPLFLDDTNEDWTDDEEFFNPNDGKQNLLARGDQDCRKAPIETADIVSWVTEHFDYLNLWGNAETDLGLMDQGLITAEAVRYVYEVNPEALRYMLEHDWAHEIGWLNAWVGLRRVVPPDFYVAIESAVQRVGADLDKFVAACRSGAAEGEIAKLLEAIRILFRELQGALAFDATEGKLMVSPVRNKRRRRRSN